ncbi:MAG: type II secretion system protein [Acidobacteria bacterium]|nr:type II secretion system protein [Acidobacteriota bacterium]
MRTTGEGVKVKGGGKTPSTLPLKSSRGWTLIELVITMTVMAVLTMAVIPIVRTSIKRQRETRLREALREIRGAIDEFHRDTVNMQCGPTGAPVTSPVPVPNGGNPNTPQGLWVDPRSRVRIADCTIFGVDNPDRYPTSLEMLVEGVDVLPRTATAAQQFGSLQGNMTETNAAPVPKKKIYLREIPVDPMTGKPDWCLLSNYDDADGGCSGSPVNVFDVHSKSEGTALNGEKYSEW